MGNGQQVVLPPSVHPDSGRAYKWKSRKTTNPPIYRPSSSPEKPLPSTTGSAKAFAFQPVPVDLLFREPRLPDTLVNLILNGQGCSDRSASLMTVSKGLARAGLSENEILSVLSDRETFLGKCAYDHTGSSSRLKAVKWLKRFTTTKAVGTVKEEQSLFTSQLETIDSIKAAVEIEDIYGEEKEPEDWKSRLRRSGKNGEGPPAKRLENILLILENAVDTRVFRKDLFRNRVSYGVATPWGGEKDKALTDTDLNLVRHWLDTHYRFEPAKDLVDDAIDILATRNSFHPIRDYLNALPPWDGKDRLATWLKDILGAEGPEDYLSQAFRKWMVAAVKRVFEPGAQFDWMLVLEGVEGLGKSTFFRTLAGEAYFRDNLPDLRDKDAAQALDGIWICELAEVEDYFRRNQREVFKAYLTRRVDKYRPPFGRKSIEAYRQCVFAGSTNEEEFLHSDSGNRRVVPVKVSARDQLWAEALLIYRSGFEESLEMEGEARKHAQYLQTEAKRVKTDTDWIVEELTAWHKKMSGQTDVQVVWNRIAMADLFIDNGVGYPPPLVGKLKWGSVERQSVAKALKKLGCHKRVARGLSYWVFPEKLATTLPPTLPAPNGGRIASIRE
jgi:predicted P-loop ATPase